MGGPRITTGDDSKQDYSTPDDFLGAVTRRFGPIQFDLAAHKLNAKHERYFAPKNFIEKFDRIPTLDDGYTPDRKKLDKYLETAVASLVRRGARELEARTEVARVVEKNEKIAYVVKNHDEGAYAFDAFAHSWADLSNTFRSPGGGPGLLWLNCEFGDIDPWADRFKMESKKGANGLLLTPAAVGSNWFRDKVSGFSDDYLLNGRLCFDGKNVFPKDCVLSHFHSNAKGDMYIWEWRKNLIHRTWKLVV